MNSLASVGINVKAMITELINVMAVTTDKIIINFPESPQSGQLEERLRLL